MTYLSERQSASFAAVRKTFEIVPEQVKTIYKYVKDKGVSPFVVFLTVFSIYMLPLNNSKKLAELELLSANEKQKLLYDFNDTAADYPKDKYVHEIFEEQVERTPNKVALVFEEKSFTYRELDKMSNALAHYLRQQGIQRNDVIPIIARRSWHISVWIRNGDITIGKPIANTQIYIVDRYLYPVPIGVVGEICIAGDGVGAGYLNGLQMTAEKFIDNPFGEGKLYKTGDLAYWREDGNIVYVGRNDFHVKIRGLRIELGEIENAISGVNGISQSAVVVRKDYAGRQFICAFYTLSKSGNAVGIGKTSVSEKSVLTELRWTILTKLPHYMMPQN